MFFQFQSAKVTLIVDFYGKCTEIYHTCMVYYSMGQRKAFFRTSLLMALWPRNCQGQATPKALFFSKNDET